MTLHASAASDCCGRSRATPLFARLHLQHTTWQLGAPMVSLFYGLRLVASIVESKIILSYTVITTGVQARRGLLLRPRRCSG